MIKNFLIIIFLTLNALCSSDISLVKDAKTPDKTKKSELIFGGWLPYWKTKDSIQSAIDHIELFDQVSPFSYEVSDSGNIINTFRKKEWADFYKLCKKNNIKIVPTIFWTDTKVMHNVLSDKIIMHKHIESIINRVVTDGVDGININYEKIKNSDKNNYLDFIRSLSQKLHSKGLVLYCCMGGRTSDHSVALPINDKQTNWSPKSVTNKITVSLNPGLGEDAADFKRTIAQYCDQIHIMGYDEWGIPYLRDFKQLDNNYYISHSSDQWIDRILQYALSYLPANKVVLGIPTYGLEFKIRRTPKSFKYKKSKNVTYPTARSILEEHNQQAKMSIGNELYFCYNKNGNNRYVCYLDADCIKSKIDIAKKYGIKGIYIFKIDGAEDPRMWKYISEIKKNK